MVTYKDRRSKDRFNTPKYNSQCEKNWTVIERKESLCPEEENSVRRSEIVTDYVYNAWRIMRLLDLRSVTECGE